MILPIWGGKKLHDSEVTTSQWISRWKPAIIWGWWLPYPSGKYEFVSWDDEIPNIWKVIKFHGSKAPTRIRNIRNISKNS
jgi:hypothetical protein